MGGAFKAIEKGYIQREISDSAYKYQRAVDAAERVIVGVNRCTTQGEPETEVLEIKAEIERKQIERLKKLKRERNSELVKEMLGRVREVAASSDNIVPVLIDAVKAYATVGEISDTLRALFGEFREPSIL